MTANNKFFAKIPLFYNMTILCVTLLDNISFIKKNYIVNNRQNSQ